VRDLSDTIRAELGAALAAIGVRPDALTFIEAVVGQRACPVGDSTAQRLSVEDRQIAERRIAEQVIGLVEAGRAGESRMVHAAEELAADPALLAAFFQNLNLLPADGGSHVDAIALLTSAALQRLAETLPDI